MKISGSVSNCSPTSGLTQPPCYIHRPEMFDCAVRYNVGNYVQALHMADVKLCASEWRLNLDQKCIAMIISLCLFVSTYKKRIVKILISKKSKSSSQKTKKHI